jgi:hypothetical protein
MFVTAGSYTLLYTLVLGDKRSRRLPPVEIVPGTDRALFQQQQAGCRLLLPLPLAASALRELVVKLLRLR